MRIVVAYRAIPDRHDWATGAMVADRLRDLGHDVEEHAKVYQSDEWAARATGPADLLVYLECNDADPQYTELAGIAPRSIYWEFDTAMHLGSSVAFAGLMRFDRTMTANWECAQQLGWGYLPYAVDEKRFVPAPEGEQSGAGLIGSDLGPRRRFCDEAGVPLISGVFGADYARALARLAVSVHYFPSGGRGLVVARPWETLGVRTCLLSEDDQSLRRQFVPGLHYEVFRSPGECRDKVAWLLTDGAPQRRKLAAAGHAFAMRHHTYLHRARALLAAVA